MKAIAITNLFLFLLFLFLSLGWTMNLWKLSQCDFEAPYKAEVIHTVGIVPIVGAVTGWMDFGE